MTIRKNFQIMFILINYIKSNIKEYILTFLIFVIGIFLGVMFINNINSIQSNEVKGYIEEYIQINQEKDIDTQTALKENIKENIILAIIIWFAGTTIIGIPIVLGIILFRGFCFGYTIAAVISTIGIGKRNYFYIFSIIYSKYTLYSSFTNIRS